MGSGVCGCSVGGLFSHAPRLRLTRAQPLGCQLRGAQLLRCGTGKCSPWDTLQKREKDQVCGGVQAVRAGSPTCPSTHSLCALTLGASWRLTSGRWIPSELVYWDLGLSCPRGSGRPLEQHLPWDSISPSPVPERPNQGTKGFPARWWCACCILSVGIVRAPWSW